MTTCPRARRSQERAFTLIEILVVVAIVFVLTSLAVMWMRSGRTAGNTARAVSAGEAYAAAIEQFGTDHRGLYPARVGSADWPVAKNGPVHPLARANPNGRARDTRYLRAIPDYVANDIIRINARGSGGMLEYRVSADRTGYELRVYDQLGDYRCSFTTNFPGAGKPCVNR